ncbi:hypothetical protein FIV42_05085 [Persicimonas caeni]|uniref:Uncharacterized protein n=1 Tax=Persicimonas caeni TaxID=2292766 RepID=A0A4Y6PPU7_PERCE|nr:crosslink repair DNA glycosylase YcaQ family protein [Persicimonas caeni]QDG50129.1 hypothetical protein FIV42_05085 [Persicimonas caeni]QED31350.1 hypothetical protein FRD00_05080 [Persicimonas caeni]
MNVRLLIDAVVRQTTVLIAQLATSAGLRAPLADIANSVFLELATELEEQGVSRKVAADMFGMALRSYQAKLRRLTARRDAEKESVWEAVFNFVREREVVTRAEVLGEFYAEDDATVRGILWDLVESGLVFQTGSGHSTAYRFASDQDFARLAGRDEHASALALIWLHVYLHGPISVDALSERLGYEPAVVEDALDTLVDEGRVTRSSPTQADAPSYRSDVCVIPMEDPAGWEASFFDHFNALVTAACVKLRNTRLQSLPSDAVGGSTYSFEIWEGHPFAGRVLGLLSDTRRELSKLREEVDAYNADNRPSHAQTSRVTFYFGQSVLDNSNDDDDEHGEAR